MEQAESDSRTKAGIFIQEFAERFYRIDYTLHPRRIEGEVQGKNSNLRWAARHLIGKYEFSEMKKNVIVRVIDCELYFRYFALQNSSFSCYSRQPPFREIL
jgi:hypothetical protein